MVVSSASSSARGHGDNRFYNPPAVRRQLQQQQQLLQRQEQQEQRQRNRRRSPQKPSRTKPRPPPAIDEVCVESDDSSFKSAVTSYSNSNSLAIPAGNLERFIEFTTPTVRAKYHRKASVRRWKSLDGVDSSPFFELGDLWESFGEWSAYGAGAPLVLSGSDSVIQYYVPYLSGIQLYVDSSSVSLRSRQPIEDSNDEIYQDESSEASSSDDHGDAREDLNRTIRPIFEYMAHDSPYGREPLADKILQLAKRFPAIKTYKSCDLLPSSWLCVAWYPIYRIPTGHTLKDLEACFLTFHSLSTSSNTKISNMHSLCNGNSSGIRPVKLSVPVFGLASYKLNGSIWTSNGQHEQQQANSLLQAAENWLRLLNANHPDFQFFLSKYKTSWRWPERVMYLPWIVFVL